MFNEHLVRTALQLTFYYSMVILVPVVVAGFVAGLLQKFSGTTDTGLVFASKLLALFLVFFVTFQSLSDAVIELFKIFFSA